MPDVAGAVNTPAEEITPLVVAQAMAGWSSRCRAELVESPGGELLREQLDHGVEGLMLILLSVWSTVTVTLLVTDSPPVLVIVAMKV